MQSSYILRLKLLLIVDKHKHYQLESDEGGLPTPTEIKHE